jgi:histidinol-phosphate aminotransferase
MGVIDIYNTASSLCLIKSNNNFHQALVPQRPTCSFQRNDNPRRVVAMTSTVPVEHVNEGQQNVTGDSFIRFHLRKLSPYQSILPFEVSWTNPFVIVFIDLICHFVLNNISEDFAIYVYKSSVD